ncbi:uncharacterized protein LOC6557542 [Drosophila grimshawi]|uniref:GH16306 n=1 Tax=Drosophila grimshawi TaxID=7222 RepID=B4IY88_DROGR|nr:uncharacterized protein LOC6557542 [Drosophila grimshawi]EDV96538.1 GH16306 [Drosophila grimshawi]
MSVDLVKTPSMHFLTGSNFEGSWNEAVHMMDGFGSYRYPDGSEYRGRFFAGKFHGFGQIKLSPPYRFTIKGVFNRGKLVSIEDMWFNDGLHVQGTLKDDHLICDNWDYLMPNDRRYQPERFYGLQPVGPTSYLTSNLTTRPVPANCFDAEEGLFNAETGWLFERPAPFSKTVYVSCPKQKKWIKRHCRAERKHFVEEPMPSFCREIIKNNLETENSQLGEITIYAPNQKIYRERYYPKLCKNETPANQQKQPQFKRTPFQTTTATELCLRAHQEKEEQLEMLLSRSHCNDATPPFDKARQWTSSSQAVDGDSGATHTISNSCSEASLHTKVKDLYDSARVMIYKKNIGNLSAVQSNLKRPTSFMDITRSIFEL